MGSAQVPHAAHTFAAMRSKGQRRAASGFVRTMTPSPLSQNAGGAASAWKRRMCPGVRNLWKTAGGSDDHAADRADCGPHT